MKPQSNPFLLERGENKQTKQKKQTNKQKNPLPQPASNISCRGGKKNWQRPGLNLRDPFCFLVPGLEGARNSSRLATFSTSPTALSPPLFLTAPHPIPTPLTDLRAIRPRRPGRRRRPWETWRIGWVSWRISSLSSRGTRGPGGWPGAAAEAAAEPAHLRLAFGSRVSEGWRRRAGGWGRFARKEEEKELMSTP